jgi:hypothetical protein
MEHSWRRLPKEAFMLRCSYSKNAYLRYKIVNELGVTPTKSVKKAISVAFIAVLGFARYAESDQSSLSRGLAVRSAPE